MRARTRSGACGVCETCLNEAGRKKGVTAARFFWWGAGRCVRSLLRQTTQVDRLTPLVHTLVRDTYAHLHDPASYTRSDLYTYTPASQRTRRSVHCVHTHTHTHRHAYIHTRACLSWARSRNRTETNRARSFMNEPNEMRVRVCLHDSAAATPSLKNRSPLYIELRFLTFALRTLLRCRCVCVCVTFRDAPVGPYLFNPKGPDVEYHMVYCVPLRCGERN